MAICTRARLNRVIALFEAGAISIEELAEAKKALMRG